MSSSSSSSAMAQPEHSNYTSKFQYVGLEYGDNFPEELRDTACINNPDELHGPFRTIEARVIFYWNRGLSFLDSDKYIDNFTHEHMKEGVIKLVMSNLVIEHDRTTVRVQTLRYAAAGDAVPAFSQTHLYTFHHPFTLSDQPYFPRPLPRTNRKRKEVPKQSSVDTGSVSSNEAVPHRQRSRRKSLDFGDDEIPEFLRPTKEETERIERIVDESDLDYEDRPILLKLSRRSPPRLPAQIKRTAAQPSPSNPPAFDLSGPGLPEFDLSAPENSESSNSSSTSSSQIAWSSADSPFVFSAPETSELPSSSSTSSSSSSTTAAQSSSVPEKFLSSSSSWKLPTGHSLGCKVLETSKPEFSNPTWKLSSPSSAPKSELTAQGNSQSSSSSKRPPKQFLLGRHTIHPDGTHSYGEPVQPLPSSAKPKPSSETPKRIYKLSANQHLLGRVSVRSDGTVSYGQDITNSLTLQDSDIPKSSASNRVESAEIKRKLAEVDRIAGTQKKEIVKKPRTD